MRALKARKVGGQVTLDEQSMVFSMCLSLLNTLYLGNTHRILKALCAYFELTAQ